MSQEGLRSSASKSPKMLVANPHDWNTLASATAESSWQLDARQPIRQFRSCCRGKVKYVLIWPDDTQSYLSVACSSRTLRMRARNLSAFRKEGQYPSVRSDDSHVSI